MTATMNRTRNQHFISQAEQRLNAANRLADPANQRIYAFDIVDRDRHVLRCAPGPGQKIARTLSHQDLFSFHVTEGADRANLEAMFGRYEARIAILTERLLMAHATNDANVGAELVELFVAKTLNFVRNPYSIRKVLNTFGQFANFHPTDPAIYAAYVQTLVGRQPHQAHLCRELDVTETEYRTWLRVLFMLLSPVAPDGAPFLETCMTSLIQQESHGVLIHVHRYDEARCLISDRGFSWPIEESQGLVFDFNLAAHAFIRFAFLPYRTLFRDGLPDAIRRGLALGPKLVNVSYLTNDLQALDSFHRRAIEQAHAQVYCSGREIHGATVIQG